VRRDSRAARPEPALPGEQGQGASSGRGRGAAVADGRRPPQAQAERAGDLASRGEGKARLAEVARGSTLNLAGAAVAAAATVGVTVLVTRRFSKDYAGAFFTAISAFLIVEAVAGLGANTGLVYFIARLRSLGEERRIPVMLRAAIVPVVVASLAGTALMLLLAGPLAHVLLAGHGSSFPPGSVTDALRALALALPFAALLDTFLGATRGYRDMRPTVVIDRMGRSVGQLAGVLIAVTLGSTALLAPLWALPYIPAAVAAWLWLRRVRRRRAPRTATLPDVPPELGALLALSTPVPISGPRPGPGRVTSARRDRASGKRMEQRQLANANPRGFWRFTTPRAVASVASITLQRIDIVLVAILKGPADAAIYTAATRFLVVGQFGNMAISMAAQPRFTELFALGDRDNANVVYQVTTAWLMLLTWPLYLLAVVYGPAVLAVFGHSYRAGSDVMIILALSMLFGTACGQVDMVLITTGRSSWSLFNGLLAVGVNVGVDLLLIPKYGITGAAIGWAVAIVVSNLMPLAQLAAVFRLNPVGRSTLAAAVVSALSFYVVPVGIRALIGAGPVRSAAAVAAGCAVFAAGLWWRRDALRLSAMPIVSVVRRRRRQVNPAA
jgi:O-antigen/teichoic acid export membrane protein